MKSTMKCPLTDGVIDSDLCFDVQECIEGDIPVTLEYEDFLEKEDCREICRRCMYNVLADQETDEKPEIIMTTDKEKNPANIMRELDAYRIRFRDMADRAQNAYDRMSPKQQEAEEGKKQDCLAGDLFLVANYLEDIVRLLSEYNG